jgi:hypothetical protein
MYELAGLFSVGRSTVYRAVERALKRTTDATVSSEKFPVQSLIRTDAP